MRVCLGGTFDLLHVGHEALLARAFALGDEEVIIGITSQRMAKRTRKAVNALATRRRNLEAYLKRKRWLGRARIAVLEDLAGPAALEGDIDAIVVSAERADAAHEINRERERRGHRAMEVVLVPMRLAEDCTPIAARRIRAGEIDREGRMERALKVRVGSTNRVKVDAAKRAFAGVFRRVQVRGVEVPSKVSAQPFEEETIDGAVARARSAIDGADYGVGIEAGLFWDEGAKDYLDVQYCAVADKGGVVTIGHGPGFAYPKAVIEAVKRGETVGEAMEAFTKVKNIGRRIGAIGWLTEGVMDRTRLTEAAILMALVPRVRRNLYFG